MFESDDVLLERYVKEQSHGAFALLVERYADLVYGTALRITNDSHAAEDAAQATFHALAHKAPALAREHVLAGWLYRTAELAAREMLRARQRRHKYEEEAGRMQSTHSASSPSWSEIRPELDAALAALPVEQRDTVVLRYLQGLSYAELAATLKCPYETVHTRLQRALRTLRGILERRGVVLSLALLCALLEQNAYAAAPKTVVSAMLQAAAQKVPVSAAPSGASAGVLNYALAGAAAVTALVVALNVFSSPQSPVMQAEPASGSVATPATSVEEKSPVLSSVNTTNNAVVQAQTIDDENAAIEKSIHSSLNWLSSIQEKDGHFNGAKFAASESQDVAVTSLAALSYLGAGHTGKQGQHSENVRLAIDWLKQNSSTDIVQEALRVLALAEHSGMTGADLPGVQRAVTSLVAMQQPSGMWQEPAAKQFYDNAIEPTTWAVFALKSAELAGAKVSSSSMSRAVQWMRLQSDGGVVLKGPQSLLCTTSLCTARLFLRDRKDSDALLAQLMDYKPVHNQEGLGSEIIGWYQGSLATFSLQQQWSEWGGATRKALLAGQIKDGPSVGAWPLRQSSETFKWGQIGITALATLSLEIHYRHYFSQMNAAEIDSSRGYNAKPEKTEGEF